MEYMNYVLQRSTLQSKTGGKKTTPHQDIKPWILRSKAQCSNCLSYPGSDGNLMLMHYFSVKYRRTTEWSQGSDAGSEVTAKSSLFWDELSLLIDYEIYYEYFIPIANPITRPPVTTNK